MSQACTDERKGAAEGRNQHEPAEVKEGGTIHVYIHIYTNIYVTRKGSKEKASREEDQREREREQKQLHAAWVDGRVRMQCMCSSACSTRRCAPTSSALFLTFPKISHHAEILYAPQLFCKMVCVLFPSAPTATIPAVPFRSAYGYGKVYGSSKAKGVLI